MAPQDLSRLKIDSNKKSRQDQRRRKNVWFIGSIVFIILVLSYLLYSGRLLPPTDIQATKVTHTFISKALTVLNASGYVVAQRKAAVSSKATGRLQNLYVEEGKKVKTGDILANLENEDLKASLEEAQAGYKVTKGLLTNAEAELEDATLNFNRQKALRESGAVSIQSFDTAEARYKKALASERVARFGVEKANASIKVAEINYEYSLIRAPFDGIILTKNADIGEVVAPFGAALNAKAAVATMADMNSVMVEVDVAESSIEKVFIGEPTEIRLDAYPNERFEGKVHMIVPTADRSKATVMTKIKFDHLDPKILPEMSAKVAFLSRTLKPDERDPILSIPVSAIKDSNGKKSVMQVRGDRVVEVPITIGRTWNDTAEVTSGLKEGDTIALNPQTLKNNQRVKAKE